MVNKLMWIDQVLASPVATAQDKAAAKAAAVLFGAVLWDNDFVPLDNSPGINLGNPNMPVKQSAIRDQFALLLCAHPMMRAKTEGVVARTAGILARDINPYGAHIGSVHYVSAGMVPTLAVMQQLKAAGIKDFFKDEAKVEKFAEFYLSSAFRKPPQAGFDWRWFHRVKRAVRPDGDRVCRHQARVARSVDANVAGSREVSFADALED